MWTKKNLPWKRKYISPRLLPKWKSQSGVAPLLLPPYGHVLSRILRVHHQICGNLTLEPLHKDSRTPRLRLGQRLLLAHSIGYLQGIDEQKFIEFLGVPKFFIVISAIYTRYVRALVALYLTVDKILVRRFFPCCLEQLGLHEYAARRSRIASEEPDACPWPALASVFAYHSSYTRPRD